ncbi:aldose epimerase family protein [Leuconostoc citreum]|nr:aldose epimerase family protein [Leuconostoc citreum]MCQ6658853.1 galactose mutarotase [Leuconostoc citreum]MDV8932515.1 galactose mutarotase [Leuconostoc citreum]WMS78732.1 aldose epimerase family protein [Leuconostoc citreum]
MMKSSITKFGEHNGQTVLMYTLINEHGTRLSVLNFAGIWHEFSVLDGNKRVNLLLSSPTMIGYTNNNYYINRLIGRVAGRIKDAKYQYQGKTVVTPKNDGLNSLHGGDNGWANTFFNVTMTPESIVLKAKITSAQDGFPGTLDSTIEYLLTSDNQVMIKMTGTQSLVDGVFNPTVHAYFNLGETSNILNHILQLKSDNHLALAVDKVPIGTLSPNQGAYDLAYSSSLKRPLIQLKNTTSEQGFDDVFVMNQSAGKTVAILKDTVSSRTIEIKSKRNGLVVFTANTMTADIPTNHGQGRRWIAVALEPQTLPNSENIPEFGDVTLKSGETRQEVIIYQYHQSF